MLRAPTTPDEGATVTAGNRAASFRVTGNQDGLKIYGGFAGAETDLSQRDPATHVTVLSGDIDQDDAPFAPTNDSDGDSTTPEQTDHLNGANSYHVLVFDGGGGIGPDVDANVTTATVLSGVTVTGGYADGSAANGRGGGLYCDGALGGACSPTLADLTFAGNLAEIGGAVYNHGEGGASSPVVKACTFNGNAAGSGASIYNDGRDDGASDPLIVNSVFTGNLAFTEGGGGISSNGTAGTSSPVIVNSTFTGNTTDGNGGALLNLCSNEGVCLPRIINSTFAGNAATGTNGFGGAILNSGAGAFGTSIGALRPEITNVLLWGNTSGGGGDQIANSFATPTLRHTLIEGGLAGISENNSSSTQDGGGNLDADPRFVDVDGSDDVLGTPDDDTRLFVGSPAIDTGEAGFLPVDVADLDDDGDTVEVLPIDGAGAARVQGATVDLGAFEGGAFTVIYVDADNTSGTADGQSWETAYTGVQAALAEATQVNQIWIADGTYTPGTSRGDSFTITGDQDGLAIYGGFAGTETTLDERDLTDRETIFSGDIGTTGDAADNAYHVLVVDGVTNGAVTGATVLADLTVTGGHANGTSPANRGGGLYCVGGGSGNACSPTLRRIVFAGNTAAAGGAIYAFGDAGESSPVITGSVFTGNTATLLGGAVLANGNNGGASSPVITSSTFAGNDAQDRGGALFASATNGGASAPAFTNALLWGNTATNGGAQVATNGGTPTYAHTLAEGLDLRATGTGNLDGTDPASDPRFVYASAPAGFDGAFGTADDGLRLSLGSPALGAGTNAALPADAADLDGDDDTTETTPFDLAGAARVQNGTVDLGAYESPFAAPATVYADPTATGGDGSQARPFGALQDAVDGAPVGSTIIVAQGGTFAGGVSIPAGNDLAIELPTGTVTVTGDLTTESALAVTGAGPLAVTGAFGTTGSGTVTGTVPLVAGPYVPGTAASDTGFRTLAFSADATAADVLAAAPQRPDFTTRLFTFDALAEKAARAARAPSCPSRARARRCPSAPASGSTSTTTAPSRTSGPATPSSCARAPPTTPAKRPAPPSGRRT